MQRPYVPLLSSSAAFLWRWPTAVENNLLVSPPSFRKPITTVTSDQWRRKLHRCSVLSLFQRYSKPEQDDAVGHILNVNSLVSKRQVRHSSGAAVSIALPSLQHLEASDFSESAFDIPESSGLVGNEDEGSRTTFDKLVDEAGLSGGTYLPLQKPDVSNAPQLGNPAPSTLRSILVRYIEHAAKLPPHAGTHHPATLLSRSQPSKIETYRFNENELALMDQTGVKADDIDLWHALLTEPDTRVAAIRFSQVSHNEGAQRLPPFVLLDFLRRRDVSPASLRHLLAATWKFLNQAQPAASSYGRPSSKSTQQSTPTKALNEWRSARVKILLLVQLLRHARHVLPAGIPSVAHIAARHLDSQTQPDSDMRSSPRRRPGLTKDYNILLQLVASPLPMHPKLFSVYQQDAHNKLLAAMAAYSKPLPVTEQGYWAVTQVNLARPHSARDKDWASLQSTSWPPWKVDRTAVDEPKDRAYGTSLAGQSLAQMRLAGYAGTDWTHSASIYSGWDMDGSPTVQTRHSASDRGIESQLVEWNQAVCKFRSKRSNHLVSTWTARIAATRTAKEAWASYLALEDTYGPMDEARPYLVLTEKLRHPHQVNAMYRLSRQSSNFQHSEHIPGAGKEASTKPLSANESVFVSRPLPTIEDVYRMMRDNEVHISAKDLVLYMSYAPSLSVLADGLRTLTYSGKQALDAMTASGFSKSNIDKIHPSLFGAICASLLRNRYNLKGVSRIYVNTPLPHPLCQSLGYPPIYRVWEALRRRESSHPSTWNRIIYSLEDLPYTPNSASTSRQSSGLRAVHKLQVMGSIEQAVFESHARAVRLTPLSLQSIFEAAKRAAFAIRGLSLGNATDLVGALWASRSVESRTETPHRALSRPQLQTMLSKNIKRLGATAVSRIRIEYSVAMLNHIRSLVKTYFYGTIGGPATDGQSAATGPKGSCQLLPIPSLDIVPSPAVLHAFVRCLASVYDFEAIAELATWMRQHWNELSVIVDELTNGRRMLRFTVVAIRSFLEGRQNGPRADEALMEEVRSVVESVPDWGGWPTEAEVASYFRQGSEDRNVFDRYWEFPESEWHAPVVDDKSDAKAYDHV